MKKSGIYKIINSVNNHCYIGSSIDIEKRWGEHRRALSKGQHHSLYLQRAWEKYDEKSFNLEIVEECVIMILLDREQYYLNTQHPEYNISPTAGSSRGVKRTLEQRQKMSGAGHPRFGKQNSDKHNSIIRNFMIGNKYAAGCIRSEETKEKIRLGLKGIKHSEERNRNRSLALLGHKHSEETKRKMSESRKRYCQLHKVGSIING